MLGSPFVVHGPSDAVPPNDCVGLQFLATDHSVVHSGSQVPSRSPQTYLSFR